MVISSALQSTLCRYQQEINRELHAVVAEVMTCADAQELGSYYGQMQYHLGWVDTNLVPTQNNPGKLLRPTLLLLAYEAAGAWGLAIDSSSSIDYLQRALPAAAAVELVHNFTLIHDDIEDGDTERRHRPTLWRRWGIPQAINTGDGMFSLARLTLWRVLERGVDGATAAQLGQILDRACLLLAEGQYLDISFESQQHISVPMYLDMIRRKTAALMSCTAEMGARLGTSSQEIIEQLRGFGEAIGLAFQVRDDILGIWATSAELGKTPAGDIYRRKKSLPILYALEHANEPEKEILKYIYQQTTPVSAEQAEAVLAVMQRTQTKTYCRAFLEQQCQLAYKTLESIPGKTGLLCARALNDMKTLVRFVEATVR